jgi:hypothetical protein
MKASLLAACLAVMPATEPAAVIQTGVFNKPHDASPGILLGVQLGGTYHLEIALGKNPGSIDGNIGSPM